MEIEFVKRGKQEPPPNIGIQRVESIKILGVIVDKHMNFQEHVNTSINACSSSLFALKTMRSHGLRDDTLQYVFSVRILPKLTYCSPAWLGFVNRSIITQLEHFLKRAIKCRYYTEGNPDLQTLVRNQEATFSRLLRITLRIVCTPCYPQFRQCLITCDLGVILLLSLARIVEILLTGAYTNLNEYK